MLCATATHAERATRRAVRQLERLGYRVTLLLPRTLVVARTEPDPARRVPGTGELGHVPPQLGD